MRYHASKSRHGRDYVCRLQNQTLAVVLEVRDDVTAKPFEGETCGVMKIRTIGEETPVEGYVTINYFYVLCYDKQPLFAPETADDAFWRNVVVNLAEHESRFGQYYSTQLNAYVRLPYPRNPPYLAEPADRHLSTSSGWQWGGDYGWGSSSTDTWQDTSSQGREWQPQSWYHSRWW